jgi:hypothetical protein
MENIRKELEELEERGHFNRTIDQVQAAIDLLERAKAKIEKGVCSSESFRIPFTHTAASDPTSAAITMGTLKKPVKDSFDHITGELKDYYSAQGRYSKAVDKVDTIIFPGVSQY